MTNDICVIGEALIDIVSAPGQEPRELIGGSPANVAIGLARLGHSTALATHLGCDPRGERIAAHLSDEGVALTSGSMSAHHTSTAAATIGDDGAATYDFDIEWKVDVDGLPASPHVHTGSIGAILGEGGDAVLGYVRELGEKATFSYDPNCRPALMGEPAEARARIEALVACADVVKASDEDITWLYGDNPDLETRRDIAEYTTAHWHELGAQLVVITLGGDGAFVSIGTEEEVAQAHPTTVVDTIGAGDSFMSGLISGLVDGGFLASPRVSVEEARARLEAATFDDMRPAVDRALSCAAITVSRAGANPPRREELQH